VEYSRIWNGCAAQGYIETMTTCVTLYSQSLRSKLRRVSSNRREAIAHFVLDLPDDRDEDVVFGFDDMSAPDRQQLPLLETEKGGVTNACC